VPPGARSIRSSIGPLPAAAPDEPVPVNTADQLASRMCVVGNGSASVAPLTKLGPAFVTVIV
jgi:hypothetical protein